MLGYAVRHRVCAITMLATVCVINRPVAVGAQEPPSAPVARSFQNLADRVEPDMTLSVIDTAGKEIAGTLADLSATSLTLLIDGNPRELPEGDVLRVTRPPHGMSRLRGGLIGAGVGFAGMAAIGVACTTANEHGDGCGSEVPVIGFGVFVGSIVAGALLAGRTEEELLFQREAGPPALTLSLAPTFSRRSKGLALTASW